MRITLLRDASKSIKASVDDVQFTLLLTLILVVLVIFFFIRNLSSTIIPSLSLPMSIFGTFAAMYLLDYSIDTISLMALTLSVGFVVDDSIVMLENIVRHLEMGKSRMQAALDGAREVGFTIVSMTFSLAAIFIPLLFLGGILGRLFREFSVTIGVAVLVSCLISLTLTPMLGSRFLREQHLVHHGRFYEATERQYLWFLGLYERSLRVVLRYKFLVLMLSLLVLIATVYLFKVVPKGFIPSEDRDFISVSTETAQDISWESLVDHMTQLAEIVRRDANVERFMMSVDTSGTMMVTLKPRAERKLSADQVIDSLRPKLNSVPGIRAMLVNPPPINIGGRRARSLYQLTLLATDTGQLYEAADALEQQMRQLPGLTDVSSDLQLKNSELQIAIDRGRALTLGVSPRQIERTLFNYFGSRTVSTIYAPNDQYNVIMEVQPRYKADAESLEKIRIRSDQGGLVPLTSVVRLEQGIGPLSINHSGQLPSVTLSFNVRPGVSLGEALDRAGGTDRRPARRHPVDLPGQRPAVSDLAGLDGLAAPPVDRRHLYRPRHPLRELHPPADHPHRPALRRFRGPGDADAVQDRADDLCLCRHHHARRPGQEERHHDDRLRHQRPREGGQERRGGDFFGLHRPFPADHDDHHVGPDGRPADRHGDRRRGRIAPAAGTRRGRRPALFPEPDPLCHPGLLPVYGQAAAVAQGQEEGLSLLPCLPPRLPPAGRSRHGPWLPGCPDRRAACRHGLRQLLWPEPSFHDETLFRAVQGLAKR